MRNDISILIKYLITFLHDQRSWETSCLFVSPHLIGGLGIIAIAAVAGSLAPWLQRRKDWE